MKPLERNIPVVLVANTRMPSKRAQSLQVAHASSAFARRGHVTTLLYARRAQQPELPAGQGLWEYYGVPTERVPEARAVRCADWIDRVPRRLQFLPARLQEWTFGRNAANVIRRDFPDSIVLTREVETAHALLDWRRLFLEIHRVPGGKLRRRWLHESAAHAVGVVAISGGVRDDLVELGVAPEKILVEHDAFEPSALETAVSRSEARASLQLDPERPVVCYTGGLLAWKGVDLLVEAARELPQVQFVIAGGMDADVAQLRRRAGDLANVRLDGFQRPARVALYLRAADIGVVPNRSQPAISSRYTSPLKLFEAMAFGLPLVVSDLPSMRDIVSADEVLYVPPDSAAELARGIGRLVEDADERARLAKNLAARASEHTWDARAERILNWMLEEA